jgi:hypothetical protein
MPRALIQVNGSDGSNINLPIGTLVSLANDGSGGETSYLWTILDQPAGPGDTLSSAISATPTFTPKKEGTYLIKLEVNGNPSLVNQVTCAVLQIKSQLRVPAAGETIESSSTEGWHGTALAASLQAFDALKADPNILVAAVGSTSLVTSDVVQFSGDYVLKSGLPGQETVVQVTALTASSSSITSADLGIIVGYVNGTPTAIGDLVYVRKRGLVTGVAGSAPTVGQSVYVNNSGVLINNTPGSNSRKVGTVINVAGSNFDAWCIFDSPFATAGGSTLSGDVIGTLGSNTLNSTINTTVLWGGGTQSYATTIQMHTGYVISGVLELNFQSANGSPINFQTGSHPYWTMQGSGTLDLGGGDAGTPGAITVPLAGAGGGGLYGGGGTRAIATLQSTGYVWGDTNYNGFLNSIVLQLRGQTSITFNLAGTVQGHWYNDGSLALGTGAIGSGIPGGATGLIVWNQFEGGFGFVAGGVFNQFLIYDSFGMDLGNISAAGSRLQGNPVVLGGNGSFVPMITLAGTGGASFDTQSNAYAGFKFANSGGTTMDLDIQCENASAAVVDAVQLRGLLTTTTAGSETSAFDLFTRSSGAALAAVFRVFHDGTFVSGSGAYPGTSGNTTLNSPGGILDLWTNGTSRLQISNAGVIEEQTAGYAENTPTGFVTGTYNMAATDRSIGADPTTGVVTVNLQVASTVPQGRVIEIYDATNQAGAHSISIVAGGADSINAPGGSVTSLTISASGGVYRLKKIGTTTWKVIVKI